MVDYALEFIINYSFNGQLAIVDQRLKKISEPRRRSEHTLSLRLDLA